MSVAAFLVGLREGLEGQDWQPSDPAKRKQLADQLVADMKDLESLVNDPNSVDDQQITIDSVSNGAISLLEEGWTRPSRPS